MATSWKIQNKFNDSGPDWDSMSTSSTDEWEDLTDHTWNWSGSSGWTIITVTKGIIGEET